MYMSLIDDVHINISINSLFFGLNLHMKEWASPSGTRWPI